MGQIRDFFCSNQIQYIFLNLKNSRICHIWGQSAPLKAQLWSPCYVQTLLFPSSFSWFVSSYWLWCHTSYQIYSLKIWYNGSEWAREGRRGGSKNGQLLLWSSHSVKPSHVRRRLNPWTNQNVCYMTCCISIPAYVSLLTYYR